jgi:hypothetical protein
MAATYQPIATTTASGSVSSITFSSIPSTYTDLVLISSAAIATGAEDARIRFNSDTATNYSFTVLSGTGTSAVSSRSTNQTFITLDNYGYMTTSSNNIAIVNIQNYANTTTYKTTVGRSNNAGTGTDAVVGLWRSTAAINSITILNSGTGGINFAAGSTFTLYGIASA